MSQVSLELTGIAASEGQALGRVYVLESVASSVPHRELMPQEVGPELKRFKEAIARSRDQMQKLIGDGNLGGDIEAIFEAQLLLLEDPMLIDESWEKIRSRKMNAEWALAEETAHLKEFLLKAKNPVFRERAADLEDMSNRILSNLMGVAEGDVRIPGLKNLPPDSILVAQDLSPSLMLHVRKNCAGIATEEGGVTGHMAILAKARGIPALVHVDGLLKHVHDGDKVLLDAANGDARLILRPSPEEEAEFRLRLNDLQGDISPAEIVSPIALGNAGDRAELWVNLDGILEEEDPRLASISGVGLFRTEFLYLKEPMLLNDLQAQIQMYASIFESFRGRSVSLRLLDAGDDKPYPPQAAVKDRDLRGVRFLLANPGILETQLRAILHACVRAKVGNGLCRLMVPVVSRFEEMAAVREVLCNLRHEIMRDTGVQLPETPLGMMLETPAAAVMAEVFASNAAFFSIGSNDLTRLALGLDRDNTLAREELFYQPALFRLIDMIQSRTSIPLSICGEIAARPDLVPVLIGLGIRHLSVSPAALGFSFAALRDLDISRCEELARSVCAAHTSADVRALL